MADDPLTLTGESLELELNPSVGGAISNLTFLSGELRVPILRKSHSPLENVLDSACFPLVPFSNRIRGGRFCFGGAEIRLAPNMAGDPSPLHGQGWTGAWSVEDSSGDEAVLAFDHPAGEWPWSYRATQRFRIEASALHMRIECRNLSDRPMPCGLGFHPYFPCGPETRIAAGVDHVWTVDRDILPVDKVEADGRYAIADDPVCGRGLDNGYGGWSGRALLTDPEWPFDIMLSSPVARFFQLYSPQSGGLFVAEPVSHANAALNAPQERWAELGIQILGPGQEMALDARIAARARSTTG